MPGKEPFSSALPLSVRQSLPDSSHDDPAGGVSFAVAVFSPNNNYTITDTIDATVMLPISNYKIRITRGRRPCPKLGMSLCHRRAPTTSRFVRATRIRDPGIPQFTSLPAA